MSQKIDYLKHATSIKHQPVSPDTKVVQSQKTMNTAAPKDIYHNTFVALEPNQRKAALIQVTSTQLNSIYHPSVVQTSHQYWPTIHQHQTNIDSFTNNYFTRISQ